MKIKINEELEKIKKICCFKLTDIGSKIILSHLLNNIIYLFPNSDKKIKEFKENVVKECKEQLEKMSKHPLLYFKRIYKIPVVCAWCGKKIDEKYSYTKGTTHGICDECLEKTFKQNQDCKKKLKRMGKIKKENGKIVEKIEKEAK